MCGIVGLVDTQPVNQSLFDALTVLQHRGQDAAGMMTSTKEGHLSMHKANGLVRDVFRTRHMRALHGQIGIAHVRYPTAGTSSEAEAQPFYVNSPYGIGLVHNGTLTNAIELKQALFKSDLRHINTHSDSEIILNVLAHELQKTQKLKPTSEDLFQALSAVYQRCRGAYACIALIAGQGLLVFRDAYGIRPLILGQSKTAEGTAYMAASESVALTAQGFDIIDDVKPGEAVFISNDGEIKRHQCTPAKGHHPCLFEFVYLARPDSLIDKMSVYKTRLNIGRYLAEHILAENPNHDIDVVIPIPETSRSSAIPLAQALDVKFREGFVKNRYIGRTFIMPGQAVRKKSVRQKLSALSLEFQNKHVLLVDDSIVRGTTSKQIIQMAREAGAKKVSFASASPPVRHPNIYGIDMPLADELIAHNKTVPEIAKAIGADNLFFLPLEKLVQSANEGNPSITRFEAAVFDGQYITGDESEYLKRVAIARQDGGHDDTDDALSFPVL